MRFPRGLVLGCLTAAGVASADAQVRGPALDGPYIRLVLDAVHGGIRRLESASGQEVAVPT
ncbi:MAG: hypothetical protein C0497_11105 [Gemmatimonas sp.]|nr:hypothetical protein [Gemmatimonas sp.]